MTLTLALSYGSREELLNAVKKISLKVKNNIISPDTIDESIINQHLYTHNLPDVDLVIRTSGEHRISNFLLWQIAYAEFYFTEVLWLDFKEQDLYEAIISYQKRERRFEKQVNKLNKFSVQLNSFKILLILVFLGCSQSFYAQEERLPFNQGRKYFLAGVNVTGKISYNEQTVVTFSGLEKGQELIVPGEEISNAIKKLGKLGLFSDIDFYASKIEGDSIWIQLNINELPKLSEVKINGVKKSKVEGLIKDNDLKKGKIVNENLITTTKNYIENKYKRRLFQYQSFHKNRT
jgi:outer membrane protein insertion porin family